MAIGTIVVIILALIVLIFLVFGFSTGWSNIWEKILNFGGGQANVATVVQACQAACATQDNYAYCSQVRDLKFSDQTVRGSCDTLKDVANSGIASCALDCSSAKLVKCTGTWQLKSEKCATGTTGKTSSVQDSEGKDITKNICCMA